MPKNRKKPSPKPEKVEERVVFVTSRLKKTDLEPDEIIVRLPFPRETKWKAEELKLDDNGKGKVGGIDFDHYGQAIRTKTDEKVLDAVKANQLQIVVGRLS